MVKCRICKERFEARPEEKDVTWIMPSKNFYYHRHCYENWKSLKLRPDEDWVEMIYDFIARDLKVSYNWHMIESQRKKFIKENEYTNKGIYYTLYWYFYVRNNKWMEDYGIGIIPHIYEQGTNYWAEKERQTAGVIKQIEELAVQRRAESTPLSSRKRKTKTIKAPE